MIDPYACPDCQGTGIFPAHDTEPCVTCNGLKNWRLVMRTLREAEAHVEDLASRAAWLKHRVEENTCDSCGKGL